MDYCTIGSSELYEIVKGNAIFNQSFNQPLSKDIIEKIKGCCFVAFFRNFNHPIDNLPEGIINLKLSSSFNYPIDNLPSSLLFLECGIKFNQTINNLPSGLEELIIKGIFDNPVDNLPSNLKKLRIYGEFNKSIDFLPIGLTELEVGPVFNQRLDNLPENLKILKITSPDYDKDLLSLPVSLEKVIINRKVKINIMEGIIVEYFTSRLFNVQM